MAITGSRFSPKSYFVEDPCRQARLVSWEIYPTRHSDNSPEWSYYPQHIRAVRQPERHPDVRVLSLTGRPLGQRKLFQATRSGRSDIICLPSKHVLALCVLNF